MKSNFSDLHWNQALRYSRMKQRMQYAFYPGLNVVHHDEYRIADVAKEKLQEAVRSVSNRRGRTRVGKNTVDDKLHYLNMKLTEQKMRAAYGLMLWRQREAYKQFYSEIAKRQWLQMRAAAASKRRRKKQETHQNIKQPELPRIKVKKEAEENRIRVKKET